ncbi:topoisomerase (DNA) II binding protein 1 [Strigomonas culicis]|uniref:Topoisomerase (DNA) II binding protein 1 n=1 Tax=Strigomonas culicis TaxID=28005 RepID=S9UPI3_9TRYP|nr:topoisomerase (DNA) II binding protein 1 [Strigomonas culicis]|eukprot:EPY16556.1 topoisomerase (DNA) II binding protein 1 [Strigomonas culicis]
MACTHFIVQKPMQTESLLCAIAAGKWVLAPSFLEESIEARAFVPEAPHEWNEARAARMGLGRTVTALVRGCRLQRTAAERPFAKWDVFLCCASESRCQSFSHVLRCGGCKYIEPRRPYELLEDCRLLQLYKSDEGENPFVLADDNMWDQEGLDEFAEISGGLQVLKLDYISKCLYTENGSSEDYRSLQNLAIRKRPRSPSADS